MTTRAEAQALDAVPRIAKALQDQVEVLRNIELVLRDLRDTLSSVKDSIDRTA